MERVEQVEKVDFFLCGVDTDERSPVTPLEVHMENSVYPIYLLYRTVLRKREGPKFCGPLLHGS